ncbi:hypothetical protein PanNE5_09470 [Pandoraea sp. NE5]|nr:hypothetical protein PanNE5_09470 [Pandoraea sp. NE5]
MGATFAAAACEAAASPDTAFVVAAATARLAAIVVNADSDVPGLEDPADAAVAPEAPEAPEAPADVAAPEACDSCLPPDAPTGREAAGD